MTRLTLPPVLILLASQATAHADTAAHLHGADTLSLAAVLAISLGLMGLSLGAAALIRARAK